MTLSCTLCGDAYTFTDDEQAFLKKMTFTFGPKSVDLPEPTECPDCRLMGRTCHRNERFLYRRTSDKSGQSMVSLYHKNPVDGQKFVIWDQEEWRSDDWDPLSYGRDFDFSRPFFEQFKELQQAVPHMALITVGNENSDFTTGTGYCKNCYLINSSEYCADCLYGKLLQTCSDCMDCAYLYDSQLCYECFSVYKSYGCTHLSFSKNCTECHFSSALTNCSHCFLCTNLNRKEYCFRNEQLTKTDYERAVAPYRDSFLKQQEALQELRKMREASTHRNANIVNCEEVTGDYIESSKNCHDCYDVNGSHDCRYLTVGVAAKDCFDCSNMYVKPELGYATLGTIETYHTAYCLYVFHSQNILLSEFCFHCKDLFGCSGLTRKQYCIFNTQFTKEEYEALVPKIIAHMQSHGEWGKFFPPELSPFGYNETVANEYSPLSKSEALKRGYYCRDTQDEPLSVDKTIPAGQLPDRTVDIPDDVLNWAISCAVSGRPFRLQKAELAFLRQQQLPLPRKHPDVRYDQRMKMHNPRRLWTRACAKCGREVRTTYSPERPETVYCENCYRELIH